MTATAEAQLPIGTELRLIIPITIRKNISHRAVPTKKESGEASAKLILSGSSRHFREYVNELAKEQGLPRSIDYGEWGIEIISYWPRLRRLDLNFPYGDIDASPTPVLDALVKGAHLFDDDVRVAPMASDREYDPDNPRIEVMLKRWR
jgi:Holliday junction resolvase RusA-like endonuclease